MQKFVFTKHFFVNHRRFDFVWQVSYLYVFICVYSTSSIAYMLENLQYQWKNSSHQFFYCVTVLAIQVLGQYIYKQLQYYFF